MIKKIIAFIFLGLATQTQPVIMSVQNSQNEDEYFETTHFLLDMNASQLRQGIARHYNRSTQNLVLTHNGNVMEDTHTLRSYGITNLSRVYFSWVNPEINTPVGKPTKELAERSTQQ